MNPFGFASNFFLIFEKLGWKDYRYYHAMVFGTILNYYQQTNNTIFNIKDIHKEPKLTKEKYEDAITAFLNKNLLTQTQEPDLDWLVIGQARPG